MNFEKPNFFDLLKQGRSIVFVQTRSMALDFRHSLPRVTEQPTWIVSPMFTIKDVLQELTHTPAHRGILILYPMQAVGFRLRVDRIVWVGPVPIHSGATGFAEYQQAMARGDFPQFGETPAKSHYTEDEIRS